MESVIKWKALEHSQSQQKGQGKHVILAAYMPTGAGMNKVVGIAPFYDLRDANLDGSVSVLEKIYGSEYYNPYDVISLMNSSNAAACVQDAAAQMKDYALVTQASKSFLQATFKVCQKALVSIMFKKALSPGIQLSLANAGLAELGKISGVAQFIVLSTMEKAIVGSICR